MNTDIQQAIALLQAAEEYHDTLVLKTISENAEALKICNQQIEDKCMLHKLQNSIDIDLSTSGKGYIYVYITVDNYVKVGYTQNPNTRLAHYNSSLGKNTKGFYYLSKPTEMYEQVEKALLVTLYKDYKVIQSKVEFLNQKILGVLLMSV